MVADAPAGVVEFLDDSSSLFEWYHSWIFEVMEISGARILSRDPPREVRGRETRGGSAGAG